MQSDSILVSTFFSAHEFRCKPEEDREFNDIIESHCAGIASESGLDLDQYAREIRGYLQDNKHACSAAGLLFFNIAKQMIREIDEDTMEDDVKVPVKALAHAILFENREEWTRILAELLETLSSEDYEFSVEVEGAIEPVGLMLGGETSSEESE